MNKRNAVLSQMAVLLEKEEQPYKRKSADLANYSGGDAMEKRLLVDDAKIDGMILSLKQLASQDDNRASSFNFTRQRHEDQ
jgi:glutamate-5-semialdehyde dehydrogenase